MGLLDVTSTVLTQFKADPSELKAALKDLTGLEKEHAKAQLDAANQRNKGYDEWIGKLGNLNQALELGGKVVSFLSDAWKEYADDMKLAAAIGTTNIDKLRDASLGLRTEQELMEFAAKATHGQFKANQAQMETAEKAMIALTRAGFDQHEVTDKVTAAMVSLKTRGLESLGVAVKEGKTDLETYNNLMQALGEKAQGVDSSSMTAAEGMQQMSVSMGDSIDNMKSALGELVQAMAPLLQALASAVAMIAELTVDATKGINWIDAANKHGAGIERDKESAGDIMQMARDSKIPRTQAEVYAAFTAAAASKYASGLPKPGESTIEMDSMNVGRRTDTAGPLSWGKWGGAGMASDGADFVDALGDRIAAAINQANSAVGDSEKKNWKNPLQSSDEMIAAGGLPSHEAFEAMRKDLEQLQKSVKPGPTILERLGLDDPSAFDMATSVLGTFTQSYAASMQALGESSMSGADIAKHALAEIIRGAAGQLAAKGAVEAVEGAALLLTGNPMGAAHLGAAALYSAGSVAAYAAASAIDGKGGGGKGGGGSGGSGGGHSGSTIAGSITSRGEDQAIKNKSDRPIVVVLGSSYDKTTPRERARDAQNILDKAMRERDE